MSRRPKTPVKAKKKANGSHVRAIAGKGKPAKPAAAKAKPTAPKKATKSTAPAKQAKTAPAKPVKPAPRPAAKPAKPATQAPPKPILAKLLPASASPKSAPTKAATNGGTNGKPVMRLAPKTEIELPAGYRPTEREPFMNELQRTYFRQKLVAWKEEILREGRSTLAHLHEDTSQHADVADRATSETDRAIELRARDRQRKLIAKINSALLRIEDGSYGYCEETGEPIGLKRLDARPIATLSLEAQERHERRERVYRDERAE